MTDLNVIVSSLVMAATAAYLATPLLRKPRPLEADMPTDAARRREALVARKAMVYQSLKDAQLDHQTGKLSTEHYDEMVKELKGQAVAIVKELEEPARSRA